MILACNLATHMLSVGKGRRWCMPRLSVTLITVRSRFSTLCDRDSTSHQARLVLAVLSMPPQVWLWLNLRYKAAVTGILMSKYWVVCSTTGWQGPRYVVLMLGLNRGPNMMYLSSILATTLMNN